MGLTVLFFAVIMSPAVGSGGEMVSKQMQAFPGKTDWAQFSSPPSWFNFINASVLVCFFFPITDHGTVITYSLNDDNKLHVFHKGTN